MPLGDSLTTGTDGQAGYRGELYRLLQLDGRPFDFVGTQPSGGAGSGQEGHPGAHVALMLSFLDLWLPAFKPHVVLLMLGTNDADMNYRDHVATYAAILDRTAELLPQTLVVVALIPVYTFAPDWGDGFNVLIAEEVRKRIAAGSHLALVDVRSAVRRRDISADGLHPNHSGYVRMAAVWHTVLSRFMTVPSVP